VVAKGRRELLEKNAEEIRPRRWRRAEEPGKKHPRVGENGWSDRRGPLKKPAYLAQKIVDDSRFVRRLHGGQREVCKSACRAVKILTDMPIALLRSRYARDNVPTKEETDRSGP